MEKERKGIVAKVFGDMADSTRTVKQINSENMTYIKEQSRDFHKEVTTPSPEFEQFKQAKGFKAKVGAAFDGMKASARATAEDEKERRADIKNHTALREFYQMQREQSTNFLGKN